MNDAPFLAMSEYDFRSKCVAFECHGHGFAREVIVRDDRESTDKSKIRGAERPLGAQLVLSMPTILSMGGYTEYGLVFENKDSANAFCTHVRVA